MPQAKILFCAIQPYRQGIHQLQYRKALLIETQTPTEQGLFAPQTPIQARLLLLNQARFGDEGIHFARALDDFQTPRLLRQSHFFATDHIAAKMRQQARFHGFAFAYVKRQIVVAINQIHAIAVVKCVYAQWIQIHGQARLVHHLQTSGL